MFNGGKLYHYLFKTMFLLNNSTSEYYELKNLIQGSS